MCTFFGRDLAAPFYGHEIGLVGEKDGSATIDKTTCLKEPTFPSLLLPNGQIDLCERLHTGRIGKHQYKLLISGFNEVVHCLDLHYGSAQ